MSFKLFFDSFIYSKNAETGIYLVSLYKFKNIFIKSDSTSLKVSMLICNKIIYMTNNKSSIVNIFKK